MTVYDLSITPVTHSIIVGGGLTFLESCTGVQ